MPVVPDFNIEPLYIDNHLLVVNKPAGMLVQGDRSGDVTLLELCKIYLKHEFHKSGNVYLGLVHRLDRPTGGIIVFARTSKSAARLSEQIRKKLVHKKYMALIEGKIKARGEFCDYLDREEKTGKIVAKNKGKYAKLIFERIYQRSDHALVSIDLITGRHHQIRVQFAHRGYPILGDIKYGSRKRYAGRNIALFAYSMTFEHPVRKEILTIEASWKDVELFKLWSDW